MSEPQKTLHELHNEIEKQRKKDRKFFNRLQWDKKEIDKIKQPTKEEG